MSEEELNCSPFTVMVKVHVLTFPAASVAVYVTTVWPMLNWLLLGSAVPLMVTGIPEGESERTRKKECVCEREESK